MASTTANPLQRSISLNTPGQQVDIECGHAGIDRDDLVIGLSWDFYPGTTPVDLDASAVCFDNLGVVQDAVYYNQLTAFNGALKHSGDSKDGAGDGFDESIAFDVDKLPMNVHMIAIVVNAHDEGSNFTHVESATCTLQDFPKATNDEFTKNGKPRTLADISIGCKGKNTGVVLCLLIRNGDPHKWTVKAAGELCPTGRNFNECMPSIRKCVDANLESWVKEERTLSLEKSFDMKKGESATIPNNLSKICVGMGWDCASSVDLDASVLVIGNGSKVDCCSYAKKDLSEWGLRHMGDNTTGAGSGDDETIRIDLAQTARRGGVGYSLGVGTSLIITVNVYSQGKSFARSVKNAYIRIYAPDQQNKTLAIFWLSNGAVTTQGLLFAELYRRDKQGWVLEALGVGCGGRGGTSAETVTAAEAVRPAKTGWRATNVACTADTKNYLTKHMQSPRGPVNSHANASLNNGGCCVIM